MLISIIITTRNSSDYIKKTLDAIVSQKYKNYEVLIVDDASDDLNELDKIATRYSHLISVRIIPRRVKKNASVTRNIGIKEAKGDVICFLDADDVWLENKLDIVSEGIINRGNVPIVLFHQSLRGTYDDINSGKATVVPESGPKTINIIDYLLNHDGVIQTSTIAINRKAADILNFDESLPRHQDVQFCIDAYSKGVEFVFIEKILSHWIILDSSVNAHVKGASVDFCLRWIAKNKTVLSEENIINYVGNVLFFIALKEKRFLRTILISISLLKGKALFSWCVFIVNVVRKISSKLKHKIKFFFS